MIDLKDEVNRVLFASTAAHSAGLADQHSSSLAALLSKCSSVSDDLSSYSGQLKLLPLQGRAGQLS